MTIALLSLCLITVALAFSIPINHQKQTKGTGYTPIFAFLSLLLGFILSQFLVWYTQLSELMSASSATFIGQGWIVCIAILWLCGLYLTTRYSQHLLRQAALFLLSSAVLILDAETQILTGYWADMGTEGADSISGIIGNIAGIVIGFVGFFMTVFFGYRLLRSLRRKLLSKRAARELKTKRGTNANRYG